MADTFSTAKLGLSVDTKQFNKEITNTSTTTERALASMKLSADTFSAKWGDLTSGIKDTKRIISGILVSQGFYTLSNAIVDVSASVLDFSMNMETAAISMEYFVQGADKAAKAAAYLRTINTFAARTPFNTEEALSLSKYMQAVGVSMNTTKSFLGVITDTAAATGATDENLQRIVFGLGQMMTKGRLANEEIRQLANANVPIYEILQEELGLTGDQISKIGKNWVSADKAVVAILTGLEKRYDGAADRVSDTVRGMTDTIVDNVKIISQAAGQGAYKAMASDLAVLRDSLDRYREVVTETGSMGLFDQILRDLDSSGEIGTSILLLIGNTRQLGASIRDTFITALPAIRVFGQAIYSSVIVAEITMNSFAQVTNTVIKGLNALGVTTGTTSQVMASLFVTYKAAKWMALLGQGAISAAYSMYQVTTSITGLLPASLSASAGVRLLTTSLAGLVAYGLTAYGVFRMVSGAMAGMNSSMSGGNIFPDSYSNAMKDYMAKMEEYNARIQQYQKSYEAPYTSIADGAAGAVDGIDKVKKASGDAAKSMKNDWTATFDEVYNIPDDPSGGGGSAGGGAGAGLPDLGEFLKLPLFNFPDIGDAELKMPEFPWEDVFEDGWLNSDVLDGDWWKSLLPFIIAGGAVQIGKYFAEHAKGVSTTVEGVAKNVGDTILAGQAAQKQAYASLGRSMDEIERLLDKTVSALQNPRISPEARELMERNLTKLVAAGTKTSEQLSDVQDALLMTGSARRGSASLDFARQLDSLNQITRSLNNVEAITMSLSDATYAQSVAGHAAIQELKQLRKDVIGKYTAYASSYGSDPVVDDLIKSAGIEMPNISNGVEAVREKLLELVTIAEEDFFESAKAQQLIKDTNKILRDLSSDAEAIGQRIRGIDTLKAQLMLLSDGLKASKAANINRELLFAVRDVLNNKEALKEIGKAGDSSVRLLEELDTKYANGMRTNEDMAKAISDMAISFDELRFSAISTQQSQIEADARFNRIIDKFVNRQLPEIMGKLASVDKYGSGLLRQTIEGRGLLRKLDQGVLNAIDAINFSTMAFKEPLEELKQTTASLLTTNLKTNDMLARVYNDVVTSMIKIGAETKASPDAVNAAISTLAGVVDKSLEKSLLKPVEDLIKQTGLSAKKVAGPISDPFMTMSDAAIARLLPKAKTADEYEEGLSKALDEIIVKLAKQQNISSIEAATKYFPQYDALLSSAVDEFKQYASEQGKYFEPVSDKTFNAAVDKIGEALKNIPAEQADMLGKGIRSDAYSVLDKMEASQKASWKNFEKALKDGGIFDISKALATGGDFGQLYLGQTSFGKTAFDALIDNLVKDSPLRRAFPVNTDTIQSKKATVIGQEAENLSNRLLAEYLKESNQVLYKTGTYVDETRKVLTQLDAAIGNSAGALFPADIKVLGDNSYNKLVQAAEAIGENVDGKTIKLTAEGFEKLMKVMPDYALQIAAQAQVVGSTNAALAVFNHEATGLSSKLGDVSKLDASTSSGIAQLEYAVRQAIMEGISDADILGSYKNSLRLLQFEIPDSAKKLVLSLADDLRKAEIALSKFASSGASLEDLVYAMSNKLATGQDVGAKGVYRYIADNFTMSKDALAEVRQIVKRIEPALKSGSRAEMDIGMKRLKQIEDTLSSVLAKYNGDAKMSAELPVQLPSMRAGGGVKEFTATAEEILTTLTAVREYSKAISGYQYALVTQYNDSIRTLESLKELGKGMSDVAYKYFDNGVEQTKLVSDIARQAQNSAKILEDIYGITDKRISRQIASMIDQGTIGTLDNPFKIANARDIAKIVSGFEKGVGKLNTLPAASAEMVGKTVGLLTDDIDDTVKALTEGAKSLNDASTLLQRGSEAFTELTKTLPGVTGVAEEAAEAIEDSTMNAARATVEAAGSTAEAASKTAEAAESLKGAASSLKSNRGVLNDDALSKIFSEVAFDAAKKYTVLREDGSNILTANISGSRLADAQARGGNSFLRTTIFDELGQMIYSPVFDGAEESLVDFFKLLEGINSSGDTAKGFNLLDANDFLKANMEALSGLMEAGRTAKTALVLSSQLDEAFKGLNLDADIARSLKEAAPEITKTLAKAMSSYTTSEEVASLGSSLAKTLAERVSAGNDEAAESIAAAIRRVITDNSKGFASAYGNTADITAELAKGIDSFFSEVTGVSDEVFEQATKTISSTYKSLSDDLVKNLLILSDGKIAERSLGRVKTYLDGVIDSGLGLAADDVGDYLNKAAKLLGKKNNKLYADEIGYAVEETLNTATKNITETLRSITPDIKLSADALDLGGEGAASAAKAAAAGAKTGKKGLTAADVLFGGALGVGALDAAALGLDAYFSSTESKAILANVAGYLDAYAQNDSTLASALEKLQKNNVDLSKLASDGSNWFTAMFGAGDLTTASWKSTGANAEITGAQAAGAGVAGLAGLGALPVAAIAALIGGGGSALYEFTGGNTMGNKYTDAYIKARDNDTIYKNALEQGLSEKEARAYSDRAMSGFRKQIFDDLDTGFWKNDDMKKILYGDGDILSKKDVLDYIFKEGNYDSKLADEFFGSYGKSDVVMGKVRGSEYGKYMDAYDNVGAFVEMLNELGDTNIDMAKMLSDNKLGAVIQAIVDFKTDFDSSLANELDVFKMANSDKGYGDGAVVRKEASWTVDSNKKDDAAGMELVNTFHGLNKELINSLKEDYGIAVGATVKDFKNTAGQTVHELFSTVSLDYSKLIDDVTAWTVKLPDTLSLSGASLSVNDMEVLAQAGIQINSDGTVTFTKAQNDNTTGTERQIKLTLDDMSSSVLSKLAKDGLSITDNGGKLNLDLDMDKLSSNMKSAMFRLNTNLTGQVSDDMKKALAGLGSVLDSGYFQITNKAVLNGSMTIEQYIKSMGSKAQELSPEVLKALTSIDDVIAQGGERTAQAVASWADGIVIPSIISKGQLTDEMKTEFAAAGITFTEQAGQLMMVINHAGDNLRDGVTIIPEETWATLNTSIQDGLRALGVTWSTNAGFVKVDISKTLGSLVTTEDIAPVRTALEGLGLEFQTSGNRIMGIVGKNGADVKDGLLTLSKDIWDTVTPETKAALDDWNVKISESGDKVMVDLNSIISSGVGEVVSLFTEKPELWNQIPQQLKDTFEAAGIFTKEGLLQINRYTISGLKEVAGSWVGFWENMPEDTRKSFEAAGINTQNGLFKIEESLDGTTIPAGVNGIIKKFDELPPEIQQAVLDSGKAISDKGYVVYNATADMVANISGAINATKGTAVTAAQQMAQEIANAVSQALRDIERLKNADVGRSGFLGTGGKNTLGNAIKGSDGIYYYPEYDNKGNVVKYHYWDNTGREQTRSRIPRAAKGGFVSGTTLTGEFGRELAILPDGSFQMLGEKKGELVDLPDGTQVLNNRDTEDVMKYTGNLSGTKSLRKLADGNTRLTLDDATKAKLDNQSAPLVSAQQAFEAAVVAALSNIFAAINQNTAAEAAAMNNAVQVVMGQSNKDATEIKSSLAQGSSDMVRALTGMESTLQSKLDQLGDAIDNMGASIRSSISSMERSASFYGDYAASKLDTVADNTLATSGDRNNVENSGLIQSAKAAWDAGKSAYDAAVKAGDSKAAAAAQAKMEGAHAAAEQVRAGAGYSGGSDGSSYISLSRSIADGIAKGISVATAEAGQKTTIKAVKGSARGSLVTKDALYRAGEFGLNEAIIPLEKPDVLSKVGAAIAASTPSSGDSGEAADLSGGTLNALILGIGNTIMTSAAVIRDANAAAIHNAVNTLLETADKQGNETANKIDEIRTSAVAQLEKTSSATEALKTAIDSMSSNLDNSIDAGADKVANAVSSAISGMSSKMSMASENVGPSIISTSATGGGGASLANSLLSGTKAVISTVSNIFKAFTGSKSTKGSARGSLVTKDALYRAGELGLNEAIIPLERPAVMKQIGEAIYGSMPVEYTDMLRSAVGMRNAGVAAPVAAPQYSQESAAQAADYAVQRVLEHVLPMMATTQQESQTPVYVGTLIADDNGLKQLERKLYVIRQAEQARRV